MSAIYTKYFYAFVFLLLAICQYGQGINIEIDVRSYANDTMILGNYFGEKQIVKDTLFSKDQKKFSYKSPEMPAPGMYLLLLKPSNTFVQFLINGKEDKISLSFDANDVSAVRFKQSEENIIFYDYLDFLKDKRVLADTLKARIARAKENSTLDKDAEDQLGILDKDVKAKQQSIISNHPTLITSLLIKSNFEVDVPEFTGEEKVVQMKRYLYYKEHYFEHIDFANPSLIRSPFIHQRIDYYMTKLSSQQPDSLIKSVDRILDFLEPNPEAYKYYLADFLNEYAQMKMVGMDAIYVHMVDKYYTKGKATWVTEENLSKMAENADELRPILIGRIMPNFTTYKEDNKPISLHSVISPYTVVIFWAPDCGHCKKIMPDVVAFYAKNKDKGVKMFSVCTKGGDKTETCWPAIKEKNMEDFINTADEYQRYHRDIKIKSTPKIFILNAQKEILIKDIPGEELDRIFNEVFEFEEKKRIGQ